MNQDPANRTDYDQSTGRLLCIAIALGAASLAANVAGRVLRIPKLIAASKIGEIAAVGIGYGAVFHQLVVEDNQQTS